MHSLEKGVVIPLWWYEVATTFTLVKLCGYSGEGIRKGWGKRSCRSMAISKETLTPHLPLKAIKIRIKLSSESSVIKTAIRSRAILRCIYLPLWGLLIIVTWWFTVSRKTAAILIHLQLTRESLSLALSPQYSSVAVRFYCQFNSWSSCWNRVRVELTSKLYEKLCPCQ